jgi:flagellar protein FliL
MATSAPKSAPSQASRNAAPDPSTDDAPKPKKSKKKLILMLLLTLIVLGGIGGGAWWYFMNDDEADVGVKKTKVEKSSPPVFVALDQFTVNLQPEAGEHYLQIAMTLQVTEKDDVDRIKLYMPQIRSRILLLLSSKKASEISSVEGKTKLSTEIMAQVNQPLTPQGQTQAVSNVFFTAFVIQ